jgi:hypothetical protein
MRLPTFALSVAVVAALGLSACGGSGHGFRAGNQNITVPNTALPTAVSGQLINWQIPLDGGCGGPYAMSVIEGALPPGLALDNATRSIVGVILLPNNYTFTIQIDDTGCVPFSSTTVQYQWNVTVGPVVVAACDPPIIPVASYNPPNTTKWVDLDAIKTTVFGAFAVFNFTLAGGYPPYTFEVVDDPNDPNDVNWSPPPGAVPQGMNIPPFSSSFIGAPQQTGGNVPYRITFQVTDSQGNVGTRKLQWKVDTPPIIVATTNLPNGRCGANYGQTIQIVDGVPPFNFELTSAFQTVLSFNSPNAPTLDVGTVDVVTGESSLRQRANDPRFPVGPGNPSAAADCYAPETTVGPYPNITPEGVYLRTTLGQFTGVPRRAGVFSWHLHVSSDLVPNEFGQHVWQSYNNITFLPSEQPPITPPQVPFAYSSLATWTQAGLLGQPPAALDALPPMEVGVAYNPDGGPAGVSCIAVAGVPKDGRLDAPHEAEAADISLGTPIYDPGIPPPAYNEFPGAYDWVVDWNPVGAGTVAPVGVNFLTETGIFHVPTPAALQAQNFQTIRLTTRDEQLPKPTYPNSITALLQFEIGPDKVIITESTTAYASTQSGPGLNDHNQTVKVVDPLSTSVNTRALTDLDDLTATGIPPGQLGGSPPNLPTLLTGIDIMRVTINPTGYWDDTFGLSSQAARPFQHADPNRYYTYGAMSWQSAQSGVYNTWEPNASSVDLPSANVGSPSFAPIANNAPAGVFGDGGRLYAFQSSTRFGIFIVRKNADIYVPLAIDRTATGFSGFGDGHLQPRNPDIRSHQQMVQMAVSPNGRVAAMKLKTNLNTGAGSYGELASTTRIVLFSLTGELLFDGGTRTYKIITTGSAGNSTDGLYQYAQSLALTDTHLYYLCGNYTTLYASWREHRVYRYTITGGAGGGAPLSPGVTWGNSGGGTNMLQTPFQLHDNDFESFNGFQITFTPTFSQTLVSTNFTSRDMYLRDGWNAVETGLAPMPFRVSGDGTTCAILAGAETGSTSHVNNQLHHVYADISGTFTKVSDASARHSPQGGGRGYSLARGPTNYRHWGAFTGPTTGFEIAHDASKIAVVVNRQTSAVTGTSNTNWFNFRQDIVAYTRTLPSTTWSSPIQVTGIEGAGTPKFSTSYLWRFGSLIFTKNSDGLVFWGGYQNWPGSAADARGTAAYQSGTYYTHRFSDGQLRSIFTQAEGGSNAGQTVTTSVAPAPYSTFNPIQGRIKPAGGFISRTRDFAYIMSQSALSTSDQTSNSLLVIAIADLTLAASTSPGKVKGNGYKLSGQVVRRGFGSEGTYASTGVYGGPTSFASQDPQGYYAPSNHVGAGEQVMARQSGYVFYASHYQRNGPTNNTTAQFTYQVPQGPEHPSYYGGEHAWGGHVEGFSSDIAGPVARMTSTSLTGDSVTRGIHYLEPHDSGRSVAFVLDTAGNVAGLSNEQVGMVQNIGFDVATGALNAGKLEKILQISPPTNSIGRAGGSMALSVNGRRLYLAFGLSASNEQSKTVYEWNTGATSAATWPVRSNGLVARYEVLATGR